MVMANWSIGIFDLDIYIYICTLANILFSAPIKRGTVFVQAWVNPRDTEAFYDFTIL